MSENANAAISSASAALGLLEQLEVLAADLQSFAGTIPSLHRKELEILIERLVSISRLLDDEANLPDLVKTAKLSGRVTSKIERLKLGGEIVRLRELGKMTVEDIANQVDVSVDSVRRFLKYYDQCKPSEKSRYQRTSVFDTSNQYEDLSAMIWRQLSRLENLDNENHVRYISEMRQLLKAAQEWMEKVNQTNKLDEIRMAVAEILVSELPEKREKILERFAAIGVRGLPTVVTVRGT